MAGGTLTERIADYLLGATFEQIPAPVVAKAKGHLLYHLGVAFGGWTADDARQARELMTPVALPSGATFIGEPLRLSAPDAAFANCSLLSAHNLDDGIFPAGIHAAVVSLPPALAIAETLHRSGKEFLTAWINSYEVMGKLGNVRWGWTLPVPRRPTMLFGAYGSVTAAGRLLGLDRAQMAAALGYAANLAMGVIEGWRITHFYSLLARNGTFCAQVAKAGGHPRNDLTLEGPRGLFRTAFGEVPEDLAASVDTLGSDWEMGDAIQKRYPGTGANIPATEVLLALVREHGLRPNAVTAVDVFLASQREPRSEVTFAGPFARLGNAVSSLPYAAALALQDGRIDAARYAEERMNDPETLALARRCTIRYEPGHDVARYVRVEVQLADGRRVSGQADGFQFPFPRAEWAGWLRREGLQRLTAAQLERAETLVADLERLPDMAELTACLVPA